MKFQKLSLAFLFFLALSWLSSCSDDKPSPIRLAYHKDASKTFDNEYQALRMNIFTEPVMIEIHGGDGSFKLTNRNENIVKATLDKRSITFTPQSIGLTEVMIEDQSGNTYPLKVSVDYPSLTFSVTGFDVYIKGDGLTTAEKKKLDEEIRAYIPSEIRNQYAFIFHNREMTEGTVEHRTSAPTHAKGTFTWERNESHHPQQYLYAKVTVKMQENRYTYTYGWYGEIVDTRAVGPRLMMFVEDVTGLFTGKYPALEKAMAVQVLEMR